MNCKHCSTLPVIFIFSICMLFSSHKAFAFGSEIHNGAELILNNWASANGDIIIGPAANITVNGDWYLTASRIYIHSTAIITGTGVIHLMSPATYGQVGAATFIDGGGITIGCRLSLENPDGVKLTSFNPAVLFPSTGIIDPGGAGTDNLRMGNNLNFSQLGATGGGSNLYLESHDLIFNAGTPTITYLDLNTVGYFPDPTMTFPQAAYIITDSTGVVTKKSLASGSAFTFPVSQSLPYDYTPATITNNSAAKDISVQVHNYAKSASIENTPSKGIDRTWMIYGSATGLVKVSLQHNTATDGALFNNAAAFVTEQMPTPGSWSSATPSNGGSPVSTHVGNFSIPATKAAPISFFSKSSDQANPLRLMLLHFKATKTSNSHTFLEWQTANETGTSHFELQRSADNQNFTKDIVQIAAAGNSTENRNYTAFDRAPLKGNNFYRLKMMDIDGQYTYSPVRIVNYNKPSNLTIAPNPATSSIEIFMTAVQDETVFYSLKDMSGKQVETGTFKLVAGVNNYRLTIAGYPPGTYALFVNGKAFKEEAKVIKLP